MLHDEHGRLELVPSMPRADGNFRIIAWLLILSFCWYHLICNDMHCTWSWAKVMLLLFQTSDHGTRAGCAVSIRHKVHAVLDASEGLKQGNSRAIARQCCTPCMSSTNKDCASQVRLRALRK
eukprot:scaffold231541_cov20-Tisochrysis_lutea.AAC.3